MSDSPVLNIECSNVDCTFTATLSLEDAEQYEKCLQCGCDTVVTHTESVSSRYSDAPVASPARKETIPKIPKQIGRFEIRRYLDKGTFGIVYLAYDPHLEREVALKIPRPESLQDSKRKRRIEQFLGDAKAAAQLRHPHIVPVYDVGQEDPDYFIASAYIEGEELSDLISKSKITVEHSARIIQSLAQALDYAHHAPIIHRDVKPRNIIVDTNGEPHLIDFGLAQRQEANTSTNGILGTAPYMSPECASGKSDDAHPAMDQYSLGITLYELLCGRVPFKGPVKMVLYNHIHSTPQSPSEIKSEVPLDLELICLKAISKRPEDRYSDCGAMAEDLRRWLAGETPSVRKLGLRERFTRWAKREPRLAGALGVAVLATLLAAVLGIIFGSVSRKQTHKLSLSNQRLTEQKAKAEELKVVAEQKAQEVMIEAAKADFDHAITLGIHGEPAQALLWLVKSLEQVEETSETRLKAVIRSNLASWRLMVHSLQDVHPISEPIQMVHYFQTTQQLMVVIKTNRGRKAWNNAISPAEMFIQFYDWKGKEFMLKHSFKIPARINQFAIGPQEKVLLTGNDKGEIQWLDLNTGGSVGEMLKLPGPITALTLSPHGKTLVTAHQEKNDTVLSCWQTPNQTLLSKGNSTFNPLVPIRKYRHAGTVASLAFHPEGTRLLVGGTKRTILAPQGVAFLWDVWSDKELASFSHHYHVKSVAFHPEGTYFATGSGNDLLGEAKLWQTTTLKEIGGGPLRHESEVYLTTFSPDGRFLATGGKGRALRLWNVVDGKPVGSPLRHTKDIHGAVFPLHSQTVITFGEEKAIRVWKIAPGILSEKSESSTGPILTAVRNKQNDNVFLGGLTKKHWNLSGSTNEPILTDIQGLVRDAATHTDVYGTEWAFGTGGKVPPNSVILWEEGAKVVTRISHPAPVFAVDIRPGDPEMIASGCADGVARIWKRARFSPMAEPVLLQSFQHPDIVYDLAFTPNGQWLITGCRDGKLRLWDLYKNDKESQPLDTFSFPDSILSIGFEPQGNRIIVGYAGGAQLLRLKSTGKFISNKISFPQIAGVLSVALSVDGNSALTGGTNGLVWWWDIDTGLPLAAPWRHQGLVPSTMFLPFKGKRLLTVSTDSTEGKAQIWELPTPIEGKAANVREWVQSVTGLDIVRSEVRVLDLTTLKERLQKRDFKFNPIAEKKSGKPHQSSIVITRKVIQSQSIPRKSAPATGSTKIQPKNAHSRRVQDETNPKPDKNRLKKDPPGNSGAITKWTILLLDKLMEVLPSPLK